MNRPTPAARSSFPQRMASMLAGHARRISPSERSGWSEAMTNELHHLPPGASPVRWALGCLCVSYTERVRAMTRWTASLPRWLLSLEMAVCLVPLTLLFIAVVANTVRGPMPLHEGLLYCLGSLVGPTGLLAALWTICYTARPLGRPTSVVLGLLALWTLVAFTGQILHDHALLTSWREFVLIAVLPALAVCHLMRINYERRALATFPTV